MRGCGGRGRRCAELLQWLEPRVLLSSNVLGNHNDAGSTGAVLDETVLMPTTVRSTQGASGATTNFGRVFDTQLDGQIYAQPLAVANVNITRGAEIGVHNVLLVATMHDSLYAVDASTGDILWRDNFTQILNPQVTGTSPSPTAGVTTVPAVSGDNVLVNGSDVGPELGILSTPAIDGATNILYVEASTQEVRGADTHFVQRLWAVSLSNGAVAITPGNGSAEPASGGKVIADTIFNGTNFSSYSGYKYVAGPYIKGTGDNGMNDSAPRDGWVVNSGDTITPWGAIGSTPQASEYIAFNATLQMNRVGVTVVNGEVYLGFASHGDQGPYYGWILGYSASTLVNNAAFVSAPTYEPFGTVSGDNSQYDAQAGFWNAGSTLTTDGTSLYLSSGNGAFNPNANNFNGTFVSSDHNNTVSLPLDSDYGDSVLKLQLDLNATQNNINVSAGVIRNPNGTYDPDGGYDANGYGIKVVDFFTPSNVYELNLQDEDIGSSGVLLVPTTGLGGASAPNGDPMLVTAGKEGRIYLLDANNLGGYNTFYVANGNETTAADPAPYDNVLGEYYYYEANGHPGTLANNQTYKGYDIPSYYNGEVYIGLGGSSAGGRYVPEVGFSISSLLFPSGVAKANRTAVYAAPTFTTGNSTYSPFFGGRGTTAEITANGGSNGILWNTNVTQASTDALVAYDTSGNLLFNSNWTLPGQTAGTSDSLTNGVSGATGVKFGVPTAFDGMVYVGTGGGSGTGGHVLGTLVGYGLLASYLASNAGYFGAPTNLHTLRTTAGVQLTWTRNSTLETGTEIDRSTDGTHWTVVGYAAAGTASFVDSSAAFATAYSYKVRAINGPDATGYTGSAAAPAVIMGDANVDGTVDLNDLNIVLNHLGTTTSQWGQGNFDGAATVDLSDLNAVLNHLGTSGAISGVSVESAVVPGVTGSKSGAGRKARQAHRVTARRSHAGAKEFIL